MGEVDEMKSLFDTTLQRYMVQMAILADLEKQIVSEGVTVTKEYVKGRANLYPNPAIAEYNKTAIAANGTIATLLHLLRGMTERKAPDIPKRIHDIMEFG